MEWENNRTFAILHLTEAEGRESRGNTRETLDVTRRNRPINVGNAPTETSPLENRKSSTNSRVRSTSNSNHPLALPRPSLLHSSSAPSQTMSVGRVPIFLHAAILYSYPNGASYYWDAKAALTQAIPSRLLQCLVVSNILYYLLY